ncbi:MAG: hypothetical protein R2854_11045 [Caldilineaceae bacterium]
MQLQVVCRRAWEDAADDGVVSEDDIDVYGDADDVVPSRRGRSGTVANDMALGDRMLRG